MMVHLGDDKNPISNSHWKRFNQSNFQLNTKIRNILRVEVLRKSVVG